MRRLVLLIAVAALMVASVAMANVAFAQGNPSCFGEFARSTPGGPGPGTTFVKPVTTAAAPGGVDELAGFVRELNQNRPCPSPSP